MNFKQLVPEQYTSPNRNIFENQNQEVQTTPFFQNVPQQDSLMQNNNNIQIQQNPYQIMNPQQQYFQNQQSNLFSNPQGSYNQITQFPNNMFSNETMLINQMMYMNPYQNHFNLFNNLNQNNKQNNQNQNQQQYQQHRDAIEEYRLLQLNTQIPWNNETRHKKNKSSSDTLLQKKLWFTVNIEYGSLNRESEGKLNSYQTQHSIVRDLKIELLQQLHNMSKLPAHKFNEYNSYSRIIFNGNIVNDCLSLEQMLGTQEPQTPIECRMQLAKCKIKLTKRGYHTFPKISDLMAADEEYLSQVEDFQITNGLGTIMWPGKTDLRFVDLDEIINITQFDVEVYNNLPTLMKPKVGEKLNKNCFSEFKISYDVLQRDWGCQTVDDMEQFLSRKFEEKQMMFINDDSFNKTVIFGKEILHFSINDHGHKQV